MALANPKSHALRILVVDDYLDNAESMAVLLRLDGHEVEVAFDGQMALHIAEWVEPQVVLCDISMPTMTGYEVARRLRGMFGNGLLLVAISANGFDEDRQRSQAAGFDHHFTKPADPCAVQSLVRDFLEAHT